MIEVSDTSVERDRRVRARLYAAAGIKELWILDISSRKLEMHREPAAAGYRVLTIVVETKSVTPLFSPESRVQVSDLLPAAR